MKKKRSIDFDFAVLRSGQCPSAYTLLSAYIVYADPRYDVDRRSNRERGICLFRTLAGQGGVTLVNGTTFALQSNTVLIARINDLARYWCQDSTWDFHWYRFTADGWTNPLPFDQVLHHPVGRLEDQWTTECIHLLQDQDAASHRMGSAIFTMFVEDLGYRWLKASEQTHRHHETVSKAVRHMRQGLSSGITVNQLAKLVGLSERQFRTVFSEVMGCSPKQYYNQLRLEQGKEMLQNTALSVAEVAEELHFSSPFHFSKAFKQYYAVPPRDARN